MVSILIEVSKGEPGDHRFILEWIVRRDGAALAQGLEGGRTVKSLVKKAAIYAIEAIELAKENTQ